MSATYFVAKYVEDPFRNEPRNVGVIVEQDGLLAGKFFGEREDGQFDGRKIGKAFARPTVYSQWRTFWRAKVAKNDLTALKAATTANFYIEPAGEITETSGSRISEVCDFAYGMLVGAGPAEAFDWLSGDDAAQNLTTEVDAELTAAAILENAPQLLAPHPILKGQKIVGKHVAHAPSYVQRNGHLSVIETIDFTSKKANMLKERAGWMAYMFADIRSVASDLEAISIVRFADATAEPIEYARNVLSGDSRIVNWSDASERAAFIEDRRTVAGEATRVMDRS